jgi:hypothetical protein
MVDPRDPLVLASLVYRINQVHAKLRDSTQATIGSRWNWQLPSPYHCFIKALTASRFVLIPGDAVAPIYGAHSGIFDSLRNLASDERVGHGSNPVKQRGLDEHYKSHSVRKVMRA